MTSNLVESPTGKRIPRPALAAIAFVAIILVGVLLRWAAERPARPEFWPFVIALAAGLAVFTYFRPIPYLSHNEAPIEPAGTAMLWAIIWGVVEGAIFWTLYYLAWSDGKYWGIALMMAALGGTNRYYHGRHLRGRHLPQVIAVALVLALMIGVKLVRRH